VLLFARFGIHGRLSRDEAVFAYGGQQLAHGVAPYASIFDPKGPGATMLGGAAAGLAHAVGRNDLFAIRAAFFACSVLATLAVYLLVRRLWHSVVAGVVAAVVFASFNGLAADALSGPDAKTPGILALVVSLWLVVRRQWFPAGVAAACAFLVWQPLLVAPVVAVVAPALAVEAGTRAKAVARAALGVVVPVAAVGTYFAIAGAFGDFIECAFVFPLTGIQRTDVTIGHRLHRIVDVVHASYGVSGLLLAIGIVVVFALGVAHVVRGRREWRTAIAAPLVCAVLVSMVFELGYAATDFQGYPDVYPLLPYGAIGVGGLAAVLSRARLRNAVATLSLVLSALLVGWSWQWFGAQAQADPGLRAQLADACGVARLVDGTGRLLSLGDPAPLVLTHRRNPDRYIYLGSGVDRWKIEHTSGGFEGWMAQISALHPPVVVLTGWEGSSVRVRVVRRLEKSGYVSRYLGRWRVFLTPAAVARAQQVGVRLAHESEAFATGPAGRELPGGTCR